MGKISKKSSHFVRFYILFFLYPCLPEAYNFCMNTKLFNNAYVAHELRNRLNVISAAIQVLQCSNLTESQKKLIDKIAYAEHSMVRLSENLLGAHKITVCPSRVNIYRLLVDIADCNAAKIHKKGLDFNCNFKLPSNRILMLDPLRIEQVIVNLLENACKFTREGSIALDAEFLKEDEEGVFLEISVSDTGSGISEDELPHIFDYGVKGKMSCGCGIGLYICNCIALALDGSLSVESTLHKGTVFRFSFYAKRAGEEF